MLATLVIGLREGLEAALIVGIIAAFLRRNGKSLTAMWWGVTLAVVLSIAVGVSLDLIERGLPQAGQEGMESVIGVIAVFFVTGMIVWMNAHARNMKRQLEAEAAQALTQTRAYALASMAFLAVLKEGFETSVFLLATFSAAQSAAWAASGALIGLLLAALIGWGIYAGGVRINLSRFFRVTGAFLILVAAGLVITSLRTAHEAGWLNAGQQPMLNLAWLVAPGTIQSALITGVLGIPADPRAIEVVGWLAYLVPVALFLYWPVALRPRARTTMRWQLAGAACLGLAAIAGFALSPAPQVHLPTEVPLVSSGAAPGAPGTARLISASADAPMRLQLAFNGTPDSSVLLPAAQRRHELHTGIDASAWTLSRTDVPAHAPTTLTLDQLVAVSGGHVPLGLSPREHPGPFSATWSSRQLLRAWIAHGVLLDAAGRNVTVVTLAGGGLRTPRTFTVSGSARLPFSSWHVSTAYREQVAHELGQLAVARSSWRFRARQLPGVLLALALALCAGAWQARRRLGLGTEAPRLGGRKPRAATLRGTARAAH